MEKGKVNLPNENTINIYEKIINSKYLNNRITIIIIGPRVNLNKKYNNNSLCEFKNKSKNEE